MAPEAGKPFTAPAGRPGVSYHITPPAPKPEPVREPVQETVSLPEQVTMEPPREAPCACGEVLRTYIICEDEQENVWLIDKHAAHERVRFDALKAATEPIMSQTLLEPMAVELSPEDCAAVLEQLPLLERYGFRCEDFGGAVLGRGVPAGVDDPTGALEELAEDLRLNRADPDTARDSLLQTMACKSAIKAGDAHGPRRAAASGGQGPVRGNSVLPPWPPGGGAAEQIPGGKNVQAGVTPGKERPMAPRVLCVVGPTASGKTKMAVALARRFGGEVVSVDSMQIYRGMTIGTAAPTAAEMEGCPII